MKPIKKFSLAGMKNIFFAATIALTVLLGFTSCEQLNDFDTPGNLVPATVDADTRLPSIEVNGTLLHAESLGDIHDPILIFLHGGPGGDYRAFISEIGAENASRYPEDRGDDIGGLGRLREKFYCVFYDQRGAGLSPRFDKGEIDFELYLEDLKGVIDYFLDQKARETGIVETMVNIFAWSFGGILATGFINRYPERVEDIVFYEPGPFTPAARDYFLERMTSVFGQIGDEWLEEYLLSHEHITSDSHERGDYQALLGAFSSQPEFHQNPDCPMWRFGSVVSKENLDFITTDKYDITSNLNAFHGRALFLAGGYTVEEFPDYMDLQQGCYPDHQLIILPGTGHTGPWEMPAEISGLARDFLSK